MRFGRRLWVAPAGQRPDGPAAVILELDPGLAFGTGTHATTALCLEWLDGRIRGGERVLDYGCGSGILALAALKLGAASAIGLRHRPAGPHRDARKRGEERPQAADRRRWNAPEALAGPSTSSSPTSWRGRWSSWRRASRGLRARAARSCSPACSTHQAAEVARAYGPWFDIAPEAEREGWTLLAGRRRAE